MRKTLTRGLVVDCSAIMGLCFEDEFTRFHDALLDHLKSESGYVPSIWAAEVSNILLVAERRKRITPAQSARFLNLLLALNLKLIDVAGLESASNILPVARDYGLSYYDAQYLHLAKLRIQPGHT